MEKISDVLNIGRGILEKNNIDIAEARLLLAFVLQINTNELITRDECTSNDVGKFLVLLEKRVNGYPYAYIVGYKEFMKLKFKVDKNVLIPRPETELLVENVLKIIQTNNYENILDLCTGSGCIAISLKKNAKDINVTASDISKKSLNIAIDNSKVLNANISFIQSNLFENISDIFDIIVSNPPYVPTKDIEQLQSEIQKEPIIALDGGIDGLDIYRTIAHEAKEHLEDNGYLCLEIGYNQGESLKQILVNEGYKDIQIIKDLSNNVRNVICRK